MVNHSCNPNCRIVPADTRLGLILLILETLRVIGDNEEITINYDAEASPTAKSQGMTFWQWRPPQSVVPKGLRRIKCGCAGIGRVCPNDLWGYEHEIRGVVTASSPTTPEHSEGNSTVQQSITVGANQQSEEQPSLSNQLDDGTETKMLAYQKPGWPQAATLTNTAVAKDPPHQVMMGKKSIPGRQAGIQGNRIEGGNCEPAEVKRRSSAEVSRADSRSRQVRADGCNISRGLSRRLQQTKLNFPTDGRPVERPPWSGRANDIWLSWQRKIAT
jgi:hypothetical protein